LYSQCWELKNQDAREDTLCKAKNRFMNPRTAS